MPPYEEDYLPEDELEGSYDIDYDYDELARYGLDEDFDVNLR